MMQAYQVFSDWVVQTINLYQGINEIEVVYTVGPIPFQDGLGREVVSVWNTGVGAVVCSEYGSNGVARSSGEPDVVY